MGYLDALSPQRRRRRFGHLQNEEQPASTADMPQLRQDQRNPDRAAAGAGLIRTHSRGGGANGEEPVNQDGQPKPSPSMRTRRSSNVLETHVQNVATSSKRKAIETTPEDPDASGDDYPPQRKKARVIQQETKEAKQVERPSLRKRKGKFIHEDESEAAESGREQPVLIDKPCAASRQAGHPERAGSSKVMTREVAGVIIPTPRSQQKGRQATMARGTGFPQCPPDAVVYNVIYVHDGSTADAGQAQSGRPDFEVKLEILGTFNSLERANKLVRATAQKWQREKKQQGATYERIECAEHAWKRTVQSLDDDDLVMCMLGRGKEKRLCCVTQDEIYGERRICVEVTTVQGDSGPEAAGGQQQETDDSQVPTPPKSTSDQAASDDGQESQKPLFIYNVYRKMMNYGNGEDEFKNFGTFLAQEAANELCYKMARKAHPKLSPKDANEEGKMEVQEAKELWPVPHRLSVMEAFRSRGGEMTYAIEDEHGRFADWWSVEKVKVQ